MFCHTVAAIFFFICVTRVNSGEGQNIIFSCCKNSVKIGPLSGKSQEKVRKFHCWWSVGTLYMHHISFWKWWRCKYICIPFDDINSPRGNCRRIWQKYASRTINSICIISYSSSYVATSWTGYGKRIIIPDFFRWHTTFFHNRCVSCQVEFVTITHAKWLIKFLIIIFKYLVKQREGRFILFEMKYFSNLKKSSILRICIFLKYKVCTDWIVVLVPSISISCVVDCHSQAATAPCK